MGDDSAASPTGASPDNTHDDDKELLINNSSADNGDDGISAAAAAAINMSPKDAYFELLRVWVTQSNLAHNAHAFFPYYMMANYPQLMMDSSVLSSSQFQQQQQQRPAGGGGDGQLHNLLGMHFGVPAGAAAAAAQPQQQQPQLFQRFAMNMFNRNRGVRRDEMFDSQARSEESWLQFL